MDKNDNELLKLVPFLEKLVELVCVSCVRFVLMSDFFHELNTSWFNVRQQQKSFV